MQTTTIGEQLWDAVDAQEAVKVVDLVRKATRSDLEFEKVWTILHRGHITLASLFAFVP